MKTYGLIGYRLGYSFSAGYFTEKFKKLGVEDSEYVNFELDTIQEFPDIFEQGKEIVGLNCTIPYKQDLMQFLDEIDNEAKAVGAVNTVKIINSGGTRKLIGYNTDVVGFRNALKPMLSDKHKKALILGTGGASKAIKFVLNQLGVDYVSASIEDKLNEKEIRYADINSELIKEHLIVINATPLGTYPKVDVCPDISYDSISSDHVLFDLVYNPEETLFMKKGSEKGAQTQNGLGMLHGQAEASWEIWNR